MLPAPKDPRIYEDKEISWNFVISALTEHVHQILSQKYRGQQYQFSLHWDFWEAFDREYNAFFVDKHLMLVKIIIIITILDTPFKKNVLFPGYGRTGHSRVSLSPLHPHLQDKMSGSSALIPPSHCFPRILRAQRDSMVLQ